MFGFVTKRAHRDMVESLRDDVRIWKSNYDKQFLAANKARDQRDAYKRQLDTANAELADFRAKRERSNANLRNANAARRMKAGRG